MLVMCLLFLLYVSIIPNCLNHLSAMIDKTSASSSIQKDMMYGSDIISMILWVKGKDAEYNNILGLVKNIDLSSNKLLGEIPMEITNLFALIYLNLSKNELSGHKVLAIWSHWNPLISLATNSQGRSLKASQT
ncbi:hypothetical protein HN873_010973 [Arachis hypogaea]|nr:Leucine-rich repeat receptor-like protein kinase [Arachis hypogaea]